MEIEPPHSWNLQLEDAKFLQNKFAQKIFICPLPAVIKTVAGFDVAYLKEENILIAGMVLIDYPSLEIIDSFVITDKILFPYIPGYLSFREAPGLLKLIEKQPDRADIFIFDGHGIAHPRGLGIAAHIGVLTQKASIGCAKKKLVGHYDIPGGKKGNYSKLVYKNKVVGNVLRTRDNVKPVIVSVGHKVNLAGATDLILRCTTRFRLPEPTRQAHRLVSDYKQKILKT
jgi:deoxyribonuclease V